MSADSRGTIFDTWEWFSAYARNRRKAHFHVLSVKRDRTPIAFAPLVQETESLIGLRLKRIRFPSNLADYNGIVASDGMRLNSYAAILNYFFNEYKDWDVIDLDELPQWSDLPSYLVGVMKHKCRVVPMSECPYLRTANWGEYLESISDGQRRHIMRAERLFNEAGRFEFSATDSMDTLEGDLDEFLRLHLARLERSPFKIRANRDFLVDVSKAFMKSGWLDLTFLRRQNETVATKLNFNFRKRCYSYNSGLNTDAKRLKEGFGIILLTHLIRRAFENGAEEYDFTRGIEEHKFRFTDSSRRNSGVEFWNSGVSSVLREELARIKASVKVFGD